MANTTFHSNEDLEDLARKDRREYDKSVKGWFLAQGIVPILLALVLTAALFIFG